MPSDTPIKPRQVTRLPLSVVLRLAWRNVLRHKGRTGTTLAAIIFGVVVLILSQGFVQDIFIQLGEALIHSQTGHLQLAKEGYFAHGAHQPDKYLVSDPEGDKRRIASLPEVADVMARLNFSGLLSNGRADYSILGEGIEPEKEAALGTFLKISGGRRLGGQNRYGVLVGHGVAQALKLRPGDRTILAVSTSDGAMNTLDLEVTGVFQTFSKEYDNRTIKIPLAAAQELLNTKGANTLVVSLSRTADTNRIADALRERTVWRDQEVKTWQELNDFYPKTVELYHRQFGGLQLIILLMVLLSVINAVNITVFERTAEFGTARALGNRGINVFQMVILENALIGLMGGALGVAFGILLAYTISRVGIPMPPPPNADLGYIAYVRVTARAVVGAFLIGFSATLLGSLLPALRVSKMPIGEALRYTA
jgi:putative ABC transport system permease protein